MQSYLKAIGLKDEKESSEIAALNKKWKEIDNKKRKSLRDRIFLLRYSKRWEKLREKENLERYSNKKALLYSSYSPLYTKKNGVAEAYINGKKDYILSRKYSFNKGTEIGSRILVVNLDNEYCGALEVVSEEFIPFKNLNEDMVDYKLAGYKNFSDYKEHLWNEYQEQGEIYKEEFTNESLLVYLKVKVLEKF